MHRCTTTTLTQFHIHRVRWSHHGAPGERFVAWHWRSFEESPFGGSHTISRLHRWRTCGQGPLHRVHLQGKLPDAVRHGACGHLGQPPSTHARSHIARCLRPSPPSSSAPPPLSPHALAHVARRLRPPGSSTLHLCSLILHGACGHLDQPPSTHARSFISHLPAATVWLPLPPSSHMSRVPY